MIFTSHTHKPIVLGSAVLLAVLSIGSLAFTTRNSRSGCSHAQGRLFNATEPGGPGRMIGTIAGDYWIDFGDPNSGTSPAAYSPSGSEVLLTWAPSRVEGPHGTIFMWEYGAIDLPEQNGPNGGVMIVVTGGMGRWQDAAGHLALSGYFHTAAGSGVWDYEGEVCTK